MLDFTLTEEQRNVRELAHDFAQKEIRPVAWDYDSDATWPQQIIEKAWQVGLRASNTAAISFNETEVPAGNLLGGENHGFSWRYDARPHPSGCRRDGDRHRPGRLRFRHRPLEQRVQFGVPIAMHQAIQFMIADLATEIEAARLLVWQSAVLLDQGQRNTLQSSHAKRFAAHMAMKVTTDAVQIYGGYGFIRTTRSRN